MEGMLYLCVSFTFLCLNPKPPSPPQPPKGDEVVMVEPS